MISVKDQAKALSNSATRPNAKENATHLIRDAKDDTQEVQVPDRKALYFLNCENCEYTVQGKPIKLSIENCKNLVLKVEDKILTGTVDIWKSGNLSLHFDRSVSTFQLDNIQSIAVRLPDAEHFGSMVWAGCEDVNLHLGRLFVAMLVLDGGLSDRTDLILTFIRLETSMETGGDVHTLSYTDLQSRNPSLRPETDQFKTTVVDGSIMTEAVVRLDNGFPATRAEQANLRQLEKQKDELLRGSQAEDE
ncbi:hypothetical protein BGZ80_010440 [Entomortierella chlamydospora]|uniref:Adenylate cyclase-associated CAP C-terminal domain-containing protein n=1 Tax=Entomortierella chlamydospora TaxID=101097 RepID=A0A9P6SZW5_9FUNG|nr:hypothetical protein BGZ79_003408 [Entomortierella chlamydospora]KAG0014440.1 hypothetical protein BGZ80_010440 [Entomortierella chlamydospora]